MRYWRQNSDGCYTILFDSTLYAECPPIDGYVRGEMHSAYVIHPPKRVAFTKDGEDEEPNECLVSCVAQCDPKGWMWSTLGYKRLFLKEVRAFKHRNICMMFILAFQELIVPVFL